MSSCFATITTASHLPRVRALARRLAHWGVELHAVLVDEDPEASSGTAVLHRLQDLGHERVEPLRAAYRGDRLRWALKPVVLDALLREHDRVVYVDTDVFAFADPSVLFDRLADHALLLTPHDYPADPVRSPLWLEATLKNGLFNAGVVGASRSGRAALAWWADACAYRCEKSLLRGLFDDQKYLDVLPVHFPDVHIERHPGVNAAEWNAEVRGERRLENGQLVYADGSPLVLYHFNGFSVRAILDEPGHVMQPLLEEYIDALNAENAGVTALDLASGPSALDRVKKAVWHWLDAANPTAHGG